MSPRLPICDESKNKSFKLSFNEKMPNRQQKVQLVNYPRDQKTLFQGLKLIRELDVDDAWTFWNQTMWNETKNIGPSNSDKVLVTN